MVVEPGYMTEVCVTDLTLAADIGIYAHEAGRRQPLVVNATLALAAPVVETMDQTVDYRGVVEAATALAEQHIPLIETFARRLADRCLALGAVTRADVTVAKPQALSAGLASVRVVALATGTTGSTMAAGSTRCCEIDMPGIQKVADFG